MTKSKSLLVAVLGITLLVPSLWAQDAKDKKRVDMLEGPATAKLGAVAQIEVPAGYAFLDGKTTRALMKNAGEPTSGNEVGFLRPTNAHWSVIFEFSSIGYVKDDDKDKLDANKLLKSYQDGTAEQNKAREAAGNPPMVIVGWEQEPRYDPITHNLTWAIRASVGGRPLLNYNTRLLGRKGVMEVVLICEPDELASILPPFQGLLANHKFQTGESYAEYRPGDKVAKYGLAALVLGGAAVGAAKLGMLSWLLPFVKKLWLLIVAAAVAVANFVKRMFNRVTGKKDEYRLDE
jgi:uncharacterized membrane-anchored protein